MQCARLFQGGTADAATYYVSKSGSDRNSCPSARSESSSKLSINGALPCLVAGDTLYVRAGVYDEGISAGTIRNFMVQYSQDRCLSRRQRLACPSSAWYVLNLTLTQQYIEFDGINMDGGSAVRGCCPKFQRKMRITSASRTPNCAGIRTAPTLCAVMLANVGGNEFINVRLHRVAGSDTSYGFYVASSDNLIENCEIYDVPGAGIHIYSEHRIGTDRNTIRNNVIHDISNSGGSTRIGE